MRLPSEQLATTVFQRMIRKEAGQVSLDSRALNFFVEVDGSKTVSEIAEKCGFGQAETRQVVEKLLELELIQAMKAAGHVVDEEFMKFLQNQLSMAIGPIAGVIIEDTVAEMGCRMEEVPAHLAPELVEQISREIQREQQRMEFKQNMVKIIMEKGYSA